MSTEQHPNERLARIEVQVERIEQDASEIKGGLKELAQAVQSLATQAMTQVAQLQQQLQALQQSNADLAKRVRTIEDEERKRAGVFAVIAVAATFIAGNWDKLLGAFK